MAKSKGYIERTTVRFRRTVAAWLDQQKVDRVHNSKALHPALINERPSRDSIIDESVVLMSVVQHKQTMVEMFGKDSEKVQELLLKSVADYPDPKF
ncbi:MAG: hypothetical protein HON77_04865 [Gammaproteobacteria bacterium]|jgi:hypothetical protein|nr:hypothetical protein [Gammaproteobacteria bacterium]